MTRFDWRRRCDGVSRRDFLRVGGLTALGLTLTVADLYDKVEFPSSAAGESES